MNGAYDLDMAGQQPADAAALGREALNPTTVVLNWYAELGR